ncbi:MAG: GNAT family N-acetyltransferase [Armatimonadetes bacterium]|nr:GNAT family N-acetyltransferase [Armatimonadota bacterium]
MFGNRELAEAHVQLRMSSSTAKTAGKLWPDLGETHAQIAGCSAAFAGDGSPLTQVNGFGFYRKPEPEDLEAVRAFYRGRTQEFEVVMNPFAVPEAWNMLFEAGAKLQTFESVLFRQTGHFDPANLDVEVQEVRPEDLDLWGRLSTEAFFGTNPPPFADDLATLLKAVPDYRRFIAYVNREPAATASLIERRGYAFLGGAAVLEEFRGHGIQRALISHRMLAVSERCHTAFVEALPGSVSQRNAEQLGFRLAFSQASLMMPS